MQEHNYEIFNCVSNCDGVINIKLFSKSNFWSSIWLIVRICCTWCRELFKIIKSLDQKHLNTPRSRNAALLDVQSPSDFSDDNDDDDVTAILCQVKQPGQ